MLQVEVGYIGLLHQRVITQAFLLLPLLQPQLLLRLLTFHHVLADFGRYRGTTASGTQTQADVTYGGRRDSLIYGCGLMV